jgi:large subunit ribosomal protein L28
MASVCDVCGKGPGFGNNVSFSHRRTPRRFNPNIQTVRTRISGIGQTLGAFGPGGKAWYHPGKGTTSIYTAEGKPRAA